jgi:hypothetical protein
VTVCVGLDWHARVRAATPDWIVAHKSLEPRPNQLLLRGMPRDAELAMCTCSAAHIYLTPGYSQRHGLSLDRSQARPPRRPDQIWEGWSPPPCTDLGSQCTGSIGRDFTCQARSCSTRSSIDDLIGDRTAPRAARRSGCRRTCQAPPADRLHKRHIADGTCRFVAD